jgi:hypothetical protein
LRGLDASARALCHRRRHGACRRRRVADNLARIAALRCEVLAFEAEDAEALGSS